MVKRSAIGSVLRRTVTECRRWPAEELLADSLQGGHLVVVVTKAVHRPQPPPAIQFSLYGFALAQRRRKTKFTFNDNTISHKKCAPHLTHLFISVQFAFLNKYFNKYAAQMLNVRIAQTTVQ